MSDPLDLLRASISDNRPAVLLGEGGAPADSITAATSLSFPQASGDAITIPKDAATRYARTDAREDFYNVGQLWLAWTEREAGVRDYLQKGQAAGVGYVAITDRRGVIDFLQGVTDGGVRVLGAGEDAKAAPAASADAGPSRPAAAQKRKYEVNTADREFCKKLREQEVELRDRNTVLRVSASGKVNNFEQFVKGTMNEKIRAFRKSFESGGRGQAAAPAAHDLNRPRKQKASTPIIIISSSPTSLITMWNVRKFLEEGQFEPSDVARQAQAQEGNLRAEDLVPVIRKRHGPHGEITTKYIVVDSVEALQKLGQDPWDRVVCVVTTGQAWQFKPYKWMDPKVLFRHVKGVYFHFHNEPVAPAIRDWNVSEMKINKLDRHTDRQVVAEFWRAIDNRKR